jgi:triacylglycerol lipase
MAQIVLAHGILGVGALPLIGGVYFNGVRALFEAHGHRVIEPSVETLGSLEQRSGQLATAIAAGYPTGEVVIVAHSMGGLDSRRVIARHSDVGPRVKTLITIATPHYGSPVADAVLDPTHPLRPHIPTWLLTALGPHAAALPDLHTRDKLQDPDRSGVTYVAIAGVSGAGQTESPLFALTKAIGGLQQLPNDGVVTLESAKHPGTPLKAQWPVDHNGAIGWPTGFLGLQAAAAVLSPPADHLARYASLLPLFPA